MLYGDLEEFGRTLDSRMRAFIDIPAGHPAGSIIEIVEKPAVVKNMQIPPPIVTAPSRPSSASDVFLA